MAPTRVGLVGGYVTATRVAGFSTHCALSLGWSPRTRAPTSRLRQATPNANRPAHCRSRERVDPAGTETLSRCDRTQHSIGSDPTGRVRQSPGGQPVVFFAAYTPSAPARPNPSASHSPAVGAAGALSTTTVPQESSAPMTAATVFLCFAIMRCAFRGSGSVRGPAMRGTLGVRGACSAARSGRCR